MSASTRNKPKNGASSVTAEPAPPVPSPTTSVSIPTITSVHAMFRDDLERYAGAGTGVRPEEQLIPFLAVLQKGSPQVNERDPAYVEGAKAGMIFNTATSKLWDAERGHGPVVVQAFSDMCENEWIPRGQGGGGFVARHPMDTPLLAQVRDVPNPQNPDSRRKLRMLPNGHQLVTTAMHYLLMVEDMQAVVVSLSSTGLQTHRRWNQMLLNKRVRTEYGIRQLQSWATALQLRTTWMKNDQGDWFSLVADDLGTLDVYFGNEVDAKMVYDEALRLHHLCLDGNARVARPTAEADVRTAPATTATDDDSPL